MKSKSQKKEELASLNEKMGKSKITIFTSFARDGEKGLSVKEMVKLKRDLKDVESEYVVNKKSLLDKSLKSAKMELDVFGYEGSLGTVFGYGDGQVISKALYGFSKKNPALKFFGAFWGDKFMDANQFIEFAKLPSKDVMIARLLGMMKYPISAMAMVLKQISNKKNLEAGK